MILPPSRFRSIRSSARGHGVIGLGLAIASLILPLPARAGESLTNVALHVVARELLLFSAPFGTWTSVRLESGERVLHRGADGNVVAVVTSSRAIGFSGMLNVADELRLPQDETVEQFKVEGNLATILTRQRALGFSAQTGKWQAVHRFYPGR
ncbi:MAG: hypothetical protein HY712_03205 [candidate division NC10 bacterium]|nr:hypothetical protein [candidate division NC10 bacterium]